MSQRVSNRSGQRLFTKYCIIDRTCDLVMIPPQTRPGEWKKKQAVKSSEFQFSRKGKLSSTALVVAAKSSLNSSFHSDPFLLTAIRYASAVPYLLPPSGTCHNSPSTDFSSRGFGSEGVPETMRGFHYYVDPEEEDSEDEEEMSEDDAFDQHACSQSCCDRDCECDDCVRCSSRGLFGEGNDNSILFTGVAG